MVRTSGSSTSCTTAPTTTIGIARSPRRRSPYLVTEYAETSADPNVPGLSAALPVSTGSGAVRRHRSGRSMSSGTTSAVKARGGSSFGMNRQPITRRLKFRAPTQRKSVLKPTSAG